MDTPIPVPLYRIVVNLVRAQAGDAAPPAPATPPIIRFFDTPLRFNDRWREGSTIFAPLFGQYDPAQSGAFLSMLPPYQTPQRRDASSVFSSLLFVPPTVLAGSFIFFDYYQPTWRQDASRFEKSPVVPQPAQPGELYRFVNGPPPWRYKDGYIHDASWYIQPQILDAPPGIVFFFLSRRRRR